MENRQPQKLNGSLTGIVRNSLEGCQSQKGGDAERGSKTPGGYQPQGYPAGDPVESAQPQKFGLPPKSGATLPPNTPPQSGFFNDVLRNSPQSTSLLAATLIFTSSGMSLAQSVGFEPALKYSNHGSYLHMQICWFVAVIIGAVISTLLIRILNKRVFNLASAFLITVHGILFVSASTNVLAIAIGRYCDGIAFGLTLIPAILAGSEQSVKKFRGLVLSIEQMGLATGIMMQVTNCNYWECDWKLDLNQMHGIISIINGVLAFGLTFVLTLESPSFYLRKDNETEAINAIRLLQRPQTVTKETYALLDENKRLLEEDNARGYAKNITASILPLLKVCLYRAFVSMSFSLPLSWALFQASAFNDGRWYPYIYAVLRLVGVVVAVLTLDFLGRKGMSAFSAIVGGAMLIFVGAIYSRYTWNPITSDTSNTIIGLLLTFQLLSGIAAPASTCYMGEAFSLSMKPYFLMIAVIFENVIQIIICCTFGKTLQSTGYFGYIVGTMQVVSAVLLYLALPETKQTSLRECLTKFKKPLPVGH